MNRIYHINPQSFILYLYIWYNMFSVHILLRPSESLKIYLTLPGHRPRLAWRGVLLFFFSPKMGGFHQRKWGFSRDFKAFWWILIWILDGFDQHVLAKETKETGGYLPDWPKKEDSSSNVKMNSSNTETYWNNNKKYRHQKWAGQWCQGDLVMSDHGLVRGRASASSEILGVL